MKKPYAVAGSLLINAGITLFLLRLWWWSAGVLAVVGLIDLYLMKRGKPTISMWVWDRWRAVGDAAIMVSIVVTTLILLGGPMALAVLVGCIVGHLRWASE